MNKKQKKLRLKNQRRASGAQTQEEEDLAASQARFEPVLPLPPLLDGSESPQQRQEWREKLLECIRQENVQLEALLLKHNTFDLLANLTISQLANDPETYKEVSHQGMAMIVEYAALLYLRHPFNVGTGLPIDGETLAEVENRVRYISVILSLYHASEAEPKGAEEDWSVEETLDFFRHRTLLQEMIVRNPGYPHHQEQRLKSLFDAREDWFGKNLGFDVGDLLRINGQLEELINESFHNCRDQAQEKAEELISLLEVARVQEKKGLPIPDDKVSALPAGFIPQLLALPKRQAHNNLRQLTGMWLFSSLGNYGFSFTAQEVTDFCDLPLERVEAILRYFSLDFVRPASGDQKTASPAPEDFRFSPTHKLKTHPFLQHEGRYLYPLPGSLIWAIQPRLEESLNPKSEASVNGDKIVWASYDRHRADYLEKESLRLLGATLRTDKVYSKLFYPTLENGKIEKAELDGLIVFDDHIFLVEAKAGSLIPAARRGAKKSLKTAFKELFGKAHSQARRAQRFIEETETPIFTTEDKKQIAVDKSRAPQIHLITATLESLDSFNAVLHRVAQTGVLEEGPLPWAVSLDVLRVICEINEFPSQLLHYLKRRQRLNDLPKMDAHDELDWFGLYLTNGLYFEGGSERDKEMADASLVMFGSATTEFDDFYLHEAGARRTSAPKPVQPMPSLFRKIVLELEEQKSHGHSEVVIQLLEWSYDVREDFCRFFKATAEKTRSDGRLHNFTLASKEGSGVTCFFTSWRDATEAMKMLQNYCVERKYRQKADAWLGLMIIVDHPGCVHGFTVTRQSWQFDADLERIVQEMPLLPSRS